MEHFVEHNGSLSDILFILAIFVVIILSWMLINFGAPKATLSFLFKALDWVMVFLIVGIGIKFNYKKH